MSLPDDVADAVQALVEAGEAPNVSAAVTMAVRERMSREQTLEVLRAHNGVPSPEDRRWAEEKLGIRPVGERKTA